MTLTASIPTVRVKRFKPAYAREHHLGPITGKTERRRIEKVAALTRARDLKSIGRGEGR